MSIVSDEGHFYEEEFPDEYVNSILFHSIIVSHLAYKVAKELELSEEKCYELAYAGIVHDIGKLCADYLPHNRDDQQKEGLYADEIRYVRNHSIDSFKVLRERGCSQYILDAVLYHHENYDGTGYPDSLNGADIPEGARILRVCDVFAALVDRRIYREALDIDTAVATMIDEVKNYDMKVFLAFERVIHDESLQELTDWIIERNLIEAEKYKTVKEGKPRRRRKRWH